MSLTHHAVPMHTPRRAAILSILMLLAGSAILSAVPAADRAPDVTTSPPTTIGEDDVGAVDRALAQPLTIGLRGFLPQAIGKLGLALPPTQRVRIVSARFSPAVYVDLRPRSRTLREILDAMCLQAGLRWRATRAGIVIDHRIDDDLRARMIGDFATAQRDLGETVPAAARKRLTETASALGHSEDVDCLRPLMIALGAPGLAGPLIAQALASGPNQTCVIAFSDDAEVCAAVEAAIRRPLTPRTVALTLAGQMRVRSVFEDCLSAAKLGLADDDGVAAIRALGGFKDHRAIDPLIALAIGPEHTQQVRQAALSVLAEIPAPRAVEPLVSLMVDQRQDLQIRINVIDVLANIGSEPALVALRNTAAGKDGAINGMAFSQLARLDDADSRAILIAHHMIPTPRGPEDVEYLAKRLVSTGNTNEYRSILTILSGMHEPRAYQALIDTIPGADNTDLVPHLHALAVCRDPATSAAVIACVAPGKEPLMRVAAARCLAQAGSVGVKTARELIDRDEDADVRCAAVSGFGIEGRLANGRHAPLVIDPNVLPREVIRDWLLRGDPSLRIAAIELVGSPTVHARLGDAELDGWVIEAVRGALVGDEFGHMGRLLLGKVDGITPDLGLHIVDEMIASAAFSGTRMLAFTRLASFYGNENLDAKRFIDSADRMVAIARDAVDEKEREAAVQAVVQMAKRFSNQQSRRKIDLSPQVDKLRADRNRPSRSNASATLLRSSGKASSNRPSPIADRPSELGLSASCVAHWSNLAVVSRMSAQYAR